VEAVVDPVVVTFASALVAAMATDAWRDARAAVVGLWRKARPEDQVDVVAAELADLREQVLVARHRSRADVEQALSRLWQSKLQELLLDDEAIAAGLRQALNETLIPLLPPEQRLRTNKITMTGRSDGDSTFNQVAGNQINIRP
jgi:hypothetical protein